MELYKFELTLSVGLVSFGFSEGAINMHNKLAGTVASPIVESIAGTTSLHSTFCAAALDCRFLEFQADIEVSLPRMHRKIPNHIDRCNIRKKEKQRHDEPDFFCMGQLRSHIGVSFHERAIWL